MSGAEGDLMVHGSAVSTIWMIILQVVIGALALLKVFLDRGRQRRFTDWMTEVFVKLDDFDLSFLYASLRKTWVQIGLATLTFVLSNFVFAFSESGSGHWDLVRAIYLEQWRSVLRDYTILVIAFLIELRWLVGSEGVRSFMLKALAILILGFASGLTYGLSGWDSRLDAYRWLQSIFIALIITPMTVAVYASMYVGAIKLAQGARWLLLKILNAISQHEKGPFLAVLAVLDVIFSTLISIVRSLR